MSGESESRPPGTLRHWQPPAAATRSRRLGPGSTEALSKLGVAPTASATPEQPSHGTTGLPIGFLLANRYVIEEHISDGGFGTVYRASDREISSHRLAIKLLHRPAQTEQAQADALRELVLIASVSHPSVVQFKDYGWHEDRLWFAMPWFAGETLDARIDSDGGRAMAPHRARPIFELLARGLAAMHEVGVNHHDVKPENIFLAEMAGFAEGLPVLLDLGIAAEEGEAPRGFSPAWVAPETARTALGDPKAVVGESADVYSLALVLRVMLEPDTAPNVDLPTPALLTARARFAVEPPKGRALRHLRKPFERWLNLDAGARPTAAEFAEELKVLTLPQDRRTARLRAARRAAPAVLAGLLGLGALGFEVQRQRDALRVEASRLEAKTHQEKQLRALSTEQRSALQRQQAQLGEQDEALRERAGEVANLDSLLHSTTHKKNALQTQLRKLGAENEGLQLELQTVKQTALELTASLEQARTRHAEVTGSLQQLTQQHTQTQRALAVLEVEHATRTEQRDGLLKQASALGSERDDLTRERNLLLGHQSQLKKRTADLDNELGTARDAIRKLRQRIKALERRASPTPTEAARVDVDGVEPGDVP